MTIPFKPASPEELLRRGVGAPTKPKEATEKTNSFRRTSTKTKD